MEINRILTDNDLDGVASASLIKRIFDTDELIHRTHQQISEGNVDVNDEDAVLDLPHIEGSGLWFDHHASNDEPEEYVGEFDPDLPSATRAIFEYYRNRDEGQLIADMESIVNAADKVDTANYSRQDIVNPDGPIMLDYIIRSNFDDYADEETSNLIAETLSQTGDCYSTLRKDEINRLVEAFRARRQRAKALLREHTERHDGVILLDQRSLNDNAAREILRVNKYLPYVIHNDAHTLLHLHQPEDDRVRIKLGFNIFLDPKEHLPSDYGKLLREFGGGGHARAAGCTVRPDEVEQAVGRVVDEITRDEKKRKKNVLAE